MGNKGNKATTTQTQTYSANPITAYGASQAMGMAENAVNTAKFNPDQLQAFQSIRDLQGSPYEKFALQYLLQSGSPLDQGDIDKYLNPYADYVRKNLQEVYGQQMRDTTGRLTSQAGGVGADRIAVGQSELARQQDLATGQTMAGIYQNALTAAEAEKQRQYMTAMGLPGLQSSQLQAIQAQAGAGAQQQAFPLQLAQYLASVTGGLSGALGGTTSGYSQTQGPVPSLLNQILGIGTAAAGAYGAYSNGKGGGSQGYNNLGTDYANNGSGIYTGDASIPGFSGSPGPVSASGAYFADGGAVDDGADVELTKAPNENIPTAWMPGAGGNHPALNMSSPSGGGGGGGGGSSTASDIGKIAQVAAQVLPMLMANKGGRIPHYASGGPYLPPNFHHNPIRVNPYMHHTGPSGSEIFHSMMPDGMEAPAFRYVRRAAGGTVNPWDQAQGFQEGGGPATFDERFSGESGPYFPPPPVTPPKPQPPVPAPSGSSPWISDDDTQIAADDGEDEGSTEFSSVNRNPYLQTSDAPMNQDMTEESMRLPQDQMPYPDATSRDWGQNLARSPWLALIEGGAKMAQTVGPVGSAIGAGIQAGVGTLSNQRKELRTEQMINQKADELHRHAIAELNKYQRMTPAQKAELDIRKLPYSQMTEFQRAEIGQKQALIDKQIQQLRLEGLKPFKVGQDEQGIDVYGIRDPKSGQIIPIDPMTGRPRTEVTAPTQSTPPAVAAKPQEPPPLGMEEFRPNLTPEKSTVKPMVKGPFATAEAANIKGIDAYMNKHRDELDFQKDQLTRLKMDYATVMKDGDKDGFFKRLMTMPGLDPEARVAAMRSANAVATAGGKPPVFDPEKVAAIEEAIKIQKTMGFAFAATISPREAAQMQLQAMSAQPGFSQSPQGMQRLIGLYDGLANHAEAKHNFWGRWKQTNPRTAAGWEEDFRAKNPMEAYTVRALIENMPNQKAKSSLPDAVRWLRANRDKPEEIAKFNRIYGNTASYFLTGHLDPYAMLH